MVAELGASGIPRIASPWCPEAEQTPRLGKHESHGEVPGQAGLTRPTLMQFHLGCDLIAVTGVKLCKPNF